jgi:hypothetical protein
MARRRYVLPLLIASAALARAWLGDEAGAYRAFNALVRNARDPGNAGWARQWLALLEQGVAQDRLLAAMREEPFAPPSFRQSFGDAR